jgi:putative nucleotidyltransferase with HDIG domain
MEIKDLEAIIARTGDLPAMPAIAVRVMEMVGDPSTSANKLQEVIGHDQALTTKVLKIANSAMFGVSRDISTLSHAIMILGFSTIRSVVLATSTKSIYMQSSSKSGFSAKVLWDHSLGTALIARNIAAKNPSINEEEAFIAGLLHDIGKTVININFAEQYEPVIREVYSTGVRFIDVEQSQLGFDHTQVGALVLRKWNLSRSLEDAVLNHHSPKQSEGNELLTAVVSLANDFCNKIGIGPETIRDINLMASGAAEMLGLNEDKLEEYEARLQEAMESNKEIFEL